MTFFAGKVWPEDRFCGCRIVGVDVWDQALLDTPFEIPISPDRLPGRSNKGQTHSGWFNGQPHEHLVFNLLLLRELTLSGMVEGSDV